MYLRKPQPRYGAGSVWTYATIAGADVDTVHVEFDSSPAEPDVNAGASFDVTWVSYKKDGDNLLDDMSQDEIDELSDRLFQDMCDLYQDGPE